MFKSGLMFKAMFKCVIDITPQGGFSVTYFGSLTTGFFKWEQSIIQAEQG